jgi:hypothetical protein
MQFSLFLQWTREGMATLAALNVLVSLLLLLLVVAAVASL